ncbi:MAG: hypothetical protein HQ596_02405, partial [Candidatus Saganbacteria bacterium]|nr:hypothetical protein [Candidatus Saganbacteria bacterium]
MAELICNAYYKGGVYRNGNGATPFALKMLVGADQKALSSTVFLTQRYARVLGIGRIRRLEPEGVVFCSGESELPSHILVRTNKLFYRIFMAPPEMQSLSEHFRLPIGVLNGALFSIAKGQKWTRNLEINLCWNRLLDPEWGRAFLRWLSKEGPLPQTLTLRRDEVPQWTEPEDAVWKAEFDALVSVTPPAERSEGLPWTNINSAHIDMPGLLGPQSFQFHDTRIERSGVLRFRRLYEHAIAYFHFRERDEDCVAGFSLFPDQFRRIGRAVEGESFDTIL